MYPKAILLVGNYRASNLGDDILAQVSLENLQKLYPEADIAFMCPRGDFPLFPAGIRSYLRFDFLKASKALKWADLVVFGGGGLLNTEVPKSLGIWGRVITKAAAKKIPVVMLGQSFSSRITARLDGILTKLDLITVRDTASELVLKKLELQVPFIRTADLAFAFNPPEKHRLKSPEFDKYALLNLRSYKALRSENTLEIAAKLIQKILDQSSIGIYLCPFELSDRKILLKLQDQFKNSGRVKLIKTRLETLEGLFLGAEFVIAQRLHCSLMAVKYAKPLLILSYASKTKSLFKDLNLEELIVDLRKTNPNEFEADLSFRDNHQSLDLTQLKQKALSNFDILKAFLDDI